MPGIPLSALNQRIDQAVERLVQADKDNPDQQRTDNQLSANPYRPAFGDDGFVDAEEAGTVSDPLTQQLYRASASFHGREVLVGGIPGGFESKVMPPTRGVERSHLRLLGRHIQEILTRLDDGAGALRADLDPAAVEAQIRGYYAEVYPASFEPKAQYVEQLRQLILSASETPQTASRPVASAPSGVTTPERPTSLGGVIGQAVDAVLAADGANPDVRNSAWQLKANPFRTPKGDNGFVDGREARRITDELGALMFDAAAAWAGETYLEGGSDGFERKVKAPVGGINAGSLRLVAEHAERIGRELEPAQLADRDAVAAAVESYFTARFRADRVAMRRLPFVKEQVTELLIASQARLAASAVD